MHDVQSVTEAVERAKSGRPDLDAALVDFLHDLLLLRVCADLESELVMRFQQLTGPTMAKGLEDTVCYSFNRLVSLNEVGGDPGHLGVSPAAFHQGCLEAQQRWPQGMLATSTHDTKRSEDVRVRIHLLSEIPVRWAEAVRRWAALNERLPARRVARPQHGVSAVSDASRRLATRGRARPHIHGEGDPRSQSPHLLDPHERRL